MIATGSMVILVYHDYVRARTLLQQPFRDTAVLSSFIKVALGNKQAMNEQAEPSTLCIGWSSNYPEQASLIESIFITIF